MVKNSLQKWGNSLGLRIPSAIAAELRMKKGTPVTLDVDDGVLTVRVARPAKRRSKYKLRELLKQIKPENVPPLYNWGPDVGEEIV